MKKVLKSLFFRIPASYVLMLHHVDDGNITPVSDCIIQYDQFIRLLKQDRKFMQMSDYLTFKAQNNGKYLLTFDDGLEEYSVWFIRYLRPEKYHLQFSCPLIFSIHQDIFL